MYYHQANYNEMGYLRSKTPKQNLKKKYMHSEWRQFQVFQSIFKILIVKKIFPYHCQHLKGVCA